MKLFDLLFGTKNKPVENKTCAPQEVQPTAPTLPEVPERSAQEWSDFFEEILTTEFASYTIKKAVAAAELVAMTGITVAYHPACSPVDFLIMKDNEPVLAVMLVRANTYRGMNVKGTYAICEAAGLQYVRFFTDMANERAYVVERMKQYLA